MTILVIGKQGQLALCLGAAGHKDVVCLGRPEVDLADETLLARVLNMVTPKIVINAGAYTSVDGAESDAENAFALNRAGPAALARLCAARGIPLIHISTDCVFDGEKAGPYEPDDEARPLSVYGESKWQGEEAVRQLCPQHLIVRVSWVFSEYAHNFVRTLLHLARTRDELTVVEDQVGYPTYCPDIAEGLLTMAAAAVQPGFAAWGTYHLAGMDETDRASMADAIFAASRHLGGPSARVIGVPTSDYPTPAKRPLNARLASTTTFLTFGIRLPDWKTRLEHSVRVLTSDLAAAPAAEPKR
ncbi:MAG: dTDP-4-dehydrorhamnose reductase [Hyphomonas sp.]|uniref:dTDP-4-dehydrorhamnose reductase n=1 Tax=Hyphomonas sp. TaxID=87 RepID=UPI0017BB6C4D|nr:dTDP-4-dehydrorhamnose reductase [Hyphomonas sp.]MBA3067796.1 dTDP-4-dehydrorhamnose reductase [Hyphomonas sp.]MBU4063917.1 dTDP-4-dehydrorhamnose reductase [Alphaproteobacteria bacterium]MBU4163285.1 dTDP-4-dehydrorhamnose reductase [Alphaproteobacteria bacterium]